MIRPDLKDLMNRHKPLERLNNNNTEKKKNNNNDTDNTSNNNNNNNNINNNNINDNNNTDCAKWKIMLRMYIKCISTKSLMKQALCIQKVDK